MFYCPNCQTLYAEIGSGKCPVCIDQGSYFDLMEIPTAKLSQIPSVDMVRNTKDICCDCQLDGDEEMCPILFYGIETVNGIKKCNKFTIGE